MTRARCTSSRHDARLAAAFALLWSFIHAVNVGEADSDSEMTDVGSADGSVTVESSRDATIQPDTGAADADSSSTSVVVIAVGFVILTGLACFLATVERRKSKQRASHDPQEENPRQKRKTFAVPDVSCTRVDVVESAHSHVPVLGDDAGHRKKREISQLESETSSSWAEASTTTSSYSIAPLSSRHRIPARPMRIYSSTRRFRPNDSLTASEHSSHTDDYSIGMLESPVSTEYSFGSEEDDIFPSSPWDELDSYRSQDYTFLSTESSDVFDSNRSRNGGSWKQVYRPTITSTVQPGTAGVLFVRQIDPRNTVGRLRLDSRGRGSRGNSPMLFDVEV